GGGRVYPYVKRTGATVTWYMHFRIYGTTSAPTTSLANLGITGVTWVTGQAVTLSTLEATPNAAKASKTVSTTAIQGIFTSVNSWWFFGGNIDLTAKPTFVE
ncbi:unnamed protein product, partial [marine sediment metagenome]